MNGPRRSLLLAAVGASAWRGATAQTEAVIEVGGSRLVLQFEPGFDATQRAALMVWAKTAANAVTSYLGRFPVPRCELLLRRVDGAGIKGGTTFAEPEPFVRVRVGEATAAAHLANDWVLVHEMIHLAVPRVPRSQNWLHEGLATYAEGVVRVKAGLNTAPRLWAELVRGLPQGQPQDDDHGLDHTPTWGRTYWGGALFCLLADVQMLERSQARAGLQQGLRGVLDAGGSYAVAWPVRRILETADRAVGQTTLVALYERMKDSAEPVDLPALWRALGVSAVTGAPAALDDSAPLAAVRRAIA